ncbi:long-chain-fatty-acid--CoA ligase [Nocardia transvalensis]|uniref:long-chain-fatty-acid--CoA ligase n=1 Tax=Nocardia transvalensis TaxID=37333 RepID=UPI001893F333|nr:long-chain-fatty-acid--CoA ligase [Nocardia transvalensis]MBF6332421.1 AMP-binding protein [Nocardia transvalensis]
MSRLTQMIFENVQSGSGEFITWCSGREVVKTWLEVHNEARIVAGALKARGIGPGAAIGVLSTSPVEMVPVIQGAWMRGAAVCLIQQPTPRADRAVWAENLARVSRTIRFAAIAVGDTFRDINDRLHTPLIPIEDLENGPDCEPVTSGESDTALYQLTSGSTGNPKAVVISHENIYENVKSIIEVFRIDPRQDVIGSWLPLYHDMGMIGALTLAMCTGTPLVKATPPDFIANPGMWPELISKYSVTYTLGPNFGYDLLVRVLSRAQEKSFDLSSLRCAINGAEPINPATITKLVEAGKRFGLTPTAILPCYGLAEATVLVSASCPGEGAKVDTVDIAQLEQDLWAVSTYRSDGRTLCTVGRIVKGFEARIVDSDDHVVPTRYVGRLKIRGRSIAQHYLTKDGFERTAGSDGWLDTGDLAYFTSDNRLVVCGRSKDLIIVAGRNIFPSDVERVAELVDGVRPGNVAAVPYYDEHRGEQLAIIAESDNIADVAAGEALKDEIAKKVIDALAIRPAIVQIVGRGVLPKTTSGKLRRSEAVNLCRTSKVGIVELAALTPSIDEDTE